MGEAEGESEGGWVRLRVCEGEGECGWVRLRLRMGKGESESKSLLLTITLTHPDPGRTKIQKVLNGINVSVKLSK